MHGRDAAAVVNDAVSAVTIHRRGLQLDGKFVDLHCRVSDTVISTGHFGPEYLELLGYELASLDKTVYEEIVRVMRQRLGEGDISGFGNQPLLVVEGDIYGLFPRLRTTLLFSILRNYMGESYLILYRMAILY